MIPWVVSRELRATLLDYLRSTWSLGDRAFEAALFQFLSGPHGIFQGPYLRLGLPFAPCPAGAAIPLDVVPPYAPHLHQLEAWQRLSSRGQSPRATLITTGTGSGKTECFLYPILDHVQREVAAGKVGIKAIILYPMNALAADQAGRFGEAVWNDKRLEGRVRVGLFVGGKGQHREMGRDHVVDDNDRQRDDPPDILLTNYRMLDLLLQRPKDARLWRNNTPETLRYLVLDELHTYDGAQGTDVACLIRRLGARLGSAETICPVGTSATVGSGASTREDLLKFASTLFDQPFQPDAFVGETRLTPRELMPTEAIPESVPSVDGPWPAPGESAESHVRAAVRAWLPIEAAKEVLEAVGGGIERVALGKWVLRLPIARALISATHASPRTGTAIIEMLDAELPRFASGSLTQQQGWLASALSLLSFAQRDVAGRALPLVSVQTTLWIREVRRLLTRVGGPPAFRFHDDSPPPQDEPWLPRYACSDCGQGGWVLTESGPGDTIGLAYNEVARAFQTRSVDLRLLHDDASVEDGVDADPPRVAWLDTKARRLLEKQTNPDLDATGAPLQPRVRVFSTDGDKIRCPGCSGLRTVRLLGARSTTLSSVAVGHLFTTPLNTDRKLLAFSDSVQDAAHRAGFFGARTYRFAMRTAILAAIPRECRIPLSNLAEATWAHWSARPSKAGVSAEAHLAALVLPVDLHYLRSVVDWHERLDEFSRERRRAAQSGEAVPSQVPDPGPQLIADLKSRLRWECTRELGVASRIGRTLEQTGCVSVTVEDSRFDAATRAIDDQLRERLGLTVETGLAATRACVAGLLTRLRLRGGVHDALLEPYLKSGGDGFQLSKQRSPLLSPFPKETTRPIFLSSAVKTSRFDSVAAPRATTWMVDWLTRTLGIAHDPGMATDVYAAILPALVQQGILIATPTEERSHLAGKKATAWGLAPAALEVSRDHVVRRCSACGHELPAVRQSATDPLDHPCSRFRCNGRYAAIAAPVGDVEEPAASDQLPVASYYRRFYERRELGRLWSKEHTGLLDRTAREELELEFKQSPRPDSPNLLSCTPTLEMGIDIGDLSATLLCSVPPDASSYVQRVGRAGRKTGNALILAFAATRPHDLYFFQEPLEAMAGTIHPPSCYLSAPEVLKRQALAFCFDGFARSGGQLKGRLGDVLKGDGGKPFPQPVVDFIRERRQELATKFFDMFGELLSPSAAKGVRDLFVPDADGLSPLETGLVRVTAETRARRDELKRLVMRLDERIKQLDTDEVEAKKVQDLDDEKSRLRDEKFFLLGQSKALREADVWGWLAEESCLPNYAFPERGVKLDAFIRREGLGQEPEHHSWVRAPAAALRELAPFNTFYASARRVVIDGVGLKRDAKPITWRFCRSCHHTEPLGMVAASSSPEAACPRCGDGRWGDVGQVRQVLPMTEVFAVARHRDAMLGDDAENRERKFYETIALFEAGAQAREAWANDAVGFGFELQPQMTLRELNLGPKDGAEKVQSVQVAGQTVADVRFVVCATCGQAKSPATGVKDSGPAREAHRAWCTERKKAADKQPQRELHLLREVRSEAIRLVVPVADGEDSEAMLANLRASLRVGLRRFYGGDPDFLDVRSYDEPLPNREGRRRFLVIFDRVPGGTGMLADLCSDRGANLKRALEQAHETLRRCDCQHRVPAVKACYQCLYVYRADREFPLLERSKALEVVETLLGAFAGLSRVDSVGTMSQSSVLESELEHRFLSELRKRVTASTGNGFDLVADGTWKLTVGARKWLLRAQVELGADRVAIPCRADFVLYPEAPGGRPIAVFTDGLAFHVMPNAPRARLADDAAKRMGVSQAGEMITWSMTWKDVVTPLDPPVGSWVGDGDGLRRLQGVLEQLDGLGSGVERLSRLSPLLGGDPMTGLVALLEAPSRLDQLARLVTLPLLQRGRRQHAPRMKVAHDAWRSAVEAPSPAMVESEGETATSLVDLGTYARLLVDLEVAKLGSLITDAGGMRVTLRLEDHADARGADGFEASWRQWLRAWNLLQVLPGAALVTRDGVTPAPRQTAPPPSAATKAAVVPQGPADPRLAAADEIADAGTRSVVRALLLQHPSLQAPRVPLELRAPTDSIEGDVELAWPEHQVGAYFDRDADLAEQLRERGWKMLAIERRPDQAAFESALGLPSLTQREGI